MAVAGVTAAHDDTVRATLKRAQDKERIHSAGAGNLDDFDISRIMLAGRSGTVSTGIAAPVTAEGHDFRFKIFLL